MIHPYTNKENEMTTLTLNELALLELCINYPSREEQLADNYSNGTVQDAYEITSTYGAALIRNLIDKGLILNPDTEGTGDWDKKENIVWLTEEGVTAYFDAVESELAKARDAHDAAFAEHAKLAVAARSAEYHEARALKRLEAARARFDNLARA